MASQRVEQVREAVESWSNGSFDLALAAVHPEVELQTRLSAAAGEPYRGVEGVRKWIGDIDEQFESWDLSIDDVLDAESGAILVLGSADLTARGSDVSFTQALAWLLTFDGDQVIRVDTYTNQAEGRRAAGLA